MHLSTQAFRFHGVLFRQPATPITIIYLIAVKKYVNMRWCWRGAEPTEWYRNKDGLPETTDDLTHGFNTDILPAEILPSDNGVQFRAVSPSSRF